MLRTETQVERRGRLRFPLALTVHFRLTRKGPPSRWGTGAVSDMSSTGISFRCRKALPVGGHMELCIDWPTARDNDCPLRLRATGFVVRSQGAKTAIQITWHDLGAQPVPAIPIRAIA